MPCEEGTREVFQQETGWGHGLWAKPDPGPATSQLCNRRQVTLLLRAS